MLRLPQQVGGDDAGAGGFVGDHEYLRRAGKQVYADPPEELALGLGDVGVAGAHDHVHGLEAIDRPEGHRRHRLHTAYGVDLVRPRQAHGVDGGSVHTVLPARGAHGDDPADPCDPGGKHAHEGRGDEPVAPARHVGPDGPHRHVAVTERDALPHLDLERRERPQLRLGEPAHLGGGQPQVSPEVLVHGGDGPLDGLLREPKALRVPAVEPLRMLAHGLLAARLDVVQDLRDPGPHLPARGGRHLLPVLEVLGHVASLLGRRRGIRRRAQQDPGRRNGRHRHVHDDHRDAGQPLVRERGEP